MAKIIVITGSPRKKGNTDILADAFISGALSAGHNVTKLCACDYKIAPCLGCNYCYKSAGTCIQKDDMEQLYLSLAKAEIFVFATPIYFYGISAQLKTLIDRLHNPIRNGFAVKKLALLAACADTRATVFDAVKVMYQSVLDYFGLENGGIVTVFGVKNKGDIIGREELADAELLGKSI